MAFVLLELFNNVNDVAIPVKETICTREVWLLRKANNIEIKKFTIITSIVLFLVDFIFCVLLKIKNEFIKMQKLEQKLIIKYSSSDKL